MQNSGFKKVGETARPFRYDLNQTPYDYTVKLMNRFKGLDLIESLKLWTEVHNIIQEAMTKTNPKKSRCNKAKYCLRKLYIYLIKDEKGKAKEKGKDVPNRMQSSRE